MIALSQVFSSDSRAVRPCYVSSVKANVGHMETVSGVAGLIKVVLMMQHGQIMRRYAPCVSQYRTTALGGKQLTVNAASEDAEIR